MLSVCSVAWLFLLGCQYQCKWLTGKTRHQNDLWCVDDDVKPYSLSHSLSHSLTHSLTHPPTHSLTHSVPLSATIPTTGTTSCCCWWWLLLFGRAGRRAWCSSTDSISADTGTSDRRELSTFRHLWWDLVTTRYHLSTSWHMGTRRIFARGGQMVSWGRKWGYRQGAASLLPTR